MDLRVEWLRIFEKTWGSKIQERTDVVPVEF